MTANHGHKARICRSVLTLAIAGLCALPVGQATAAPDQSSTAANPPSFTLRSPDITEGQPIPEAQVFNAFGCRGRNVSPALSWSGAPPGTKSFALLVHDPDAPTGSGWWHWLVYDIPANVSSLPADAGNPRRNLLPAGALQGRTDFGTAGYGGPCPPPGKAHHYYFRLYALKVAKLDVPGDATAAMIGFNVNANALGKTQLMGLYGR